MIITVIQNIDIESNINLFLQLFQQIGVYGIIILLLGKHPWIRDCFSDASDPRAQTRLTVFFILLVTLSEFLATPYHGTRLYSGSAVVIAASYLMGSLFWGTILGAIAGLYQFFLGEWAGLAQFASSVAIGSISGYLGKNVYRINTRLVLQVLFICLVKMLVFFALLSDYPIALFFLVKSGFATFTTDFLGALLLLFVLNFMNSEQEKEQSFATSNALHIAGKTIVYFKGGFSAEGAKQVCSIIHRSVPVDIVAITDNEQVLSAFGAIDNEVHGDSAQLFDRDARKAMRTGEIVYTRRERHRRSKRLPYNGLYVPLKASDEVTGLLILRNWGNRGFSPYVQELISGLQQLIGIQIEFAKLQKHKELSMQAELLALQRQINPHFFFNSLNTIMSLIRIDPPKARRLLLKMSEIFRITFKSTGDTVPLSSEIEIVKGYLELEKARFGDNIEVNFAITPAAMRFQLPQLIIQPLVENCFAHAFKGKPGKWSIDIRIDVQDNTFTMSVADNGHGVDPKELNSILDMGVGKGSGVGLSNVYERLKNLYGKRLDFTVESPSEGGFVVNITIYGTSE
ncbi:histidine kinase [Desulfurispira natronophila]|uniref:histidine kinase n=1 Tax=Desulfurispira natronophila TaxID=682562 RepID=A0A7W7Y2J4_9BACT|nr:histidine kinase [Desulfurispira natronophila]MBB5020915.1 LytS/YehU family sensor histidine kinase [Desulfurispira natronophila]